MQDDLGSVLGLTDKDCNIIESYDYDEFGNEIELVSNPIQSLTYTGYRKELATNSLYAQARQYNPRVGRFTSEDIVPGSMIFPLTFNKYKYCLNSPLVYVDPDGMKECFVEECSDTVNMCGIGISCAQILKSIEDVFVQKVEDWISIIGSNGSHAPNFSMNLSKGGATSRILPKCLKFLGPFLNIVGTTLDVVIGIKDNIQNKEQDIKKYYSDVVVDICIDMAPVVMESIVTAALLGSVAPGVGTLIGATVGLVSGVASYLFLDKLTYRSDDKTGRQIIKEKQYEVLPVRERINTLNAEFFVGGDTLILVH